MIEPLSQDDYDLNVFEQLPFNIYTQLCLCFPVGDDSSHSAIITTLTHGLERLSASFPWLAGKIVNEGSGQGNTGVFKIKPFQRIPPLVVKDLKHEPRGPLSTMEALRKANFPFTMLDENIICPRKTFPDDSASDSPVFLLQANFIPGGLVLSILGHHNAMDMTGQGQIIDLLSKACRNEPFTSEELSSGNLPRRNLIPLLNDSYSPGPELAHQIVRPTNVQPTPAPPPKSSWAYFTFPPPSLSALKSLAMETLPPTPTLSYISTDDALSAFLWQSILRARLPRLAPTSSSTFGRAVNTRQHLGVSEVYPGLVQNMMYSTRTLQEIVSAPLGVVAAWLREELDSERLGYRSRALATLLSRTADKNLVNFTATLDLSIDFMLSSWAKLDCYELDFGLGLGLPEAVRRPRFDPVESLGYLMPKTREGEIAVAICLREEDMERLKEDAVWGRHAVYVG